jgi:hypothetical protein
VAEDDGCAHAGIVSGCQQAIGADAAIGGGFVEQGFETADRTVDLTQRHGATAWRYPRRNRERCARTRRGA